MSTQIKRLYLSGKEFVPITLSEAVVVKTTNIPGLGDEITTLDKVLMKTLADVVANSSNITSVQGTLENAVKNINEQLSKKQDKLTAGSGITIEKSGDDLIISTNLSFEIYKVVESLPAASASCTNTIYLVPTTGVSEDKDILEEYMCIPQGNTYVWERLGRVLAGVDLSQYISRIEKLELDVSALQIGMSSTITAEDVTTSTNGKVVVTYDIPATLYDSVVATDDGDQITS